MLSPISRIEYSIFSPGEPTFRSFMLSVIQLRPLAVFVKSNVQPLKIPIFKKYSFLVKQVHDTLIFDYLYFITNLRHLQSYHSRPVSIDIDTRYHKFHQAKSALSLWLYPGAIYKILEGLLSNRVIKVKNCSIAKHVIY